MWKDFKEFAVRGNVVDMAVGIVVGSAFTAIAKSLVDDVIMPPLGWALGDVNFADFFLVLREGATVAGPYATLADAAAAGAVTVNYGQFANTIVQFLLVALAMFMVISYITKLQSEAQTAPDEDSAVRVCQYCREAVDPEARRCPHCTSDLA